MHILLSNDDGVHALGIRCLHAALQATEHRVTMIAPDRNNSGTSSAMTLRHPLYPTKLEEDLYQVDGTPTDCVHIALTGYLPELPDCVISGINHGSNMGDDTIYSGTVGAAIEGRHLAKPALAISLVGERHFETAAQVTLDLLAQLTDKKLPQPSVLNVNVPDLPYSELRGIRSTRLGRRALGNNVDVDFHPRAAHCLWVGTSGAAVDDGEGTDFHAVRNGFVSVTPINMDLTDHSQLPALQFLHDNRL